MPFFTVAHQELKASEPKIRLLPVAIALNCSGLNALGIAT